MSTAQASGTFGASGTDRLDELGPGCAERTRWEPNSRQTVKGTVVLVGRLREPISLNLGPGWKLLCLELGGRIESLGEDLEVREGTLNETDKEEGRK